MLTTIPSAFKLKGTLKTPRIKPLSEGEETFALHLKSKGIAFEREYKFHPDRRWRFDFVLPEMKVAIEIEGGVWSKSRHTSPQGFIDDCEKYNAAAALDWVVFRYTTDMVKRGQAIEQVAGFLA